MSSFRKSQPKKEEPVCGTYDAVILIDMQEKFVPGLRKGGKEIIKNHIAILRRCAEQDVPLVVLEFNGYGPTVSELREVIAQVPRQEFILKYEDSGFSVPNLKTILEVWGAKRLLLMGINAAFCVLETAQDAISLGYAIVTSSGLISGMAYHVAHDMLDWYEANGTLIAV